jgi:hypothetical protein
MSLKKIALALAAVGALGLVACSEDSVNEAGTSSVANGSSSAAVTVDTIVMQAEPLDVGGSTNATLGSYFDVDGNVVFSGSDIADATKAAKVDIVFAPNATTAEIWAPSETSNALKTTGSQTVKFVALSDADVAKLDISKDSSGVFLSTSLKAAYEAGTKVTKLTIDLEEGTGFLVMTSAGAVLPAYVTADEASTKSAGLVVGSKKK